MFPDFNVCALILMCVPPIAPTTLGSSEKCRLNVAIGAAVSAAVVGNLIYSFRSSYSPFTTSQNDS